MDTLNHRWNSKIQFWVKDVKQKEIIWGIIYMEFRNRQNSSMVTKIRTLIVWQVAIAQMGQGLLR